MYCLVTIYYNNTVYIFSKIKTEVLFIQLSYLKKLIKNSVVFECVILICCLYTYFLLVNLFYEKLIQNTPNLNLI